MDRTEPRGYRYPECDPPLVQDAADIIHVKNLAEDIDTDIESIADEAEANIIRPTGVELASFVSGNVYDSFTPISWTNQQFATDNGMADAGGLYVVRDGTYLLTLFIAIIENIPVNAGVRARVVADGAELIDSPGLVRGTNSNYTGSWSTAVSGSSVQRLTDGQRLQFYVDVRSSTFSEVTVDRAFCSYVRLGPL